MIWKPDFSSWLFLNAYKLFFYSFRYGGALRASGEMASAQYITAGWCLE